MADHPDHSIIVALTGACTCGRCCARIDTEVLPERRQVVEPVIHSEVTEYRIVSGTCACGRVQRSAFPDGIDASVQYGPGVSAFAVYMTQYQLLPYQRTADALDELAGIAISPGTIHRAVEVAAMRLEAPVPAIRGASSARRRGSTAPRCVCVPTEPVGTRKPTWLGTTDSKAAEFRVPSAPFPNNDEVDLG